jgi:type III secretory pathway component EscS
VENPLRSEDAAFRFLIRVVIVAAAVVGIVVIVQAIT